MLPKKNRLMRKQGFDAAFQGGRGGKRRFLAFQCKKNNLPDSRFGFIVSKKVSLKAVDRNCVKRRLRSLVARRIGEIKAPMDIVIIALSGANHKTPKDFKEVVSDIFSAII